jgi:hypothetical protein
MGWRGEGHPRGGRSVGVLYARTAILVAPLFISGLPLGLFDATSPAIAGAGFVMGGLPPPVAVNETLTVRNQTTNNLSNFWGAGLNPGYNLTNLTNETQDTPLNWVVWPAGDVADTFDMTNGTTWTGGAPTHILNNESQFVSACKAISCQAIFTVPGEIDNPSFGAYEVWYTEKVLDFHPVYWEIGNEPFQWQHFGQNWTQWNSTTRVAPTAMQYAWVVHAYIAAMKLVDPTLRFIGLPGVGNGAAPDMPWLTATVQVNGPNLSAVAVHEYPAEDGEFNATLGDFMGSLLAPKTYMVTRLADDEKAVRSAEANISCTSCSIQLFMDEFGTATQLSYDQAYLHSYAETPYVTAELLMMSESNVSNADLFELRSDYNGSLFDGTGVPFPLDTLYTQLLPHYDTLVLNTSVTGTLKGVFAGASESPSANSITLLAVNTNATQSVQLNVAGGVFPNRGSYEAWQESNSTAAPNGSVTQSYGSQTASGWLLPPLGVLLVSACRSNTSLGTGGIYPLTFCVSGLPAGTSWSVTVGSTLVTSTTGSISLAEPNGTYSYRIGAVPGWSATNTSGSVAVSGAPSSIEVPWTPFTYRVTFNETGLPLGTRWSATLEGNLYWSNTTNLNGYASNGTQPYSLGIVSGWRPQNSSGFVELNATPAWLNVTWSKLTYLITVHQQGLNNTTNWSVDLGGSVGSNGSGGDIQFLETNGTYVYTVGSVPGFTPDAASGVVTVKGYPKVVSLSFATNSTVYPIWFNESKLPVGTVWNVSLDGTEQSGASAGFTFAEPNGTYAYMLAGAAGWRPLTYTGNVTVTGTAIPLTIAYLPVKYTVTFRETGLPSPMPNGDWSVDFNGTTTTSVNSTLSLSEPNGTYRYRLGSEAGYTTNSCSRTIVVDGHSTGCAVRWTVFLWTVTFTELGLHSAGGPTTWTLEVAGQDPHKSPLSAPPYSEGFANGTYNFTATSSVAGWGLDPTDQNFTVNGRPLSIPLKFAPYYPVSFVVVSGLSPGANWSVYLNGYVSYGNGSTIAMAEPNGTLNYTIGAVSGLFPNPASGTLTVSGGPVLVPISFEAGTSPVTFTEKGLPSGTNWSVTLNGTMGSTTLNSDGGSIVTFQAGNGSYTYDVSAPAGYTVNNSSGNLLVSGTPLSFNLTFVSNVYLVTIRESTLPAGMNWSITMNSVTQSTTTNGLTDTLLWTGLANGTYNYAIAGISGWHQGTLAYGGTLAVNGGTGAIDGTGVGYAITLVYNEVTYSVTFSESGLPSGLTWQVTVDGVSNSLTTDRATDSLTQPGLPNGTYAYAITDNSGWHQSTLAYTGNFALSGSSGSEPTLAYTPVTYTVTISESTLPSGESWSITLDGVSQTATTNGLADTLTWTGIANGTYGYRIVDISGWHQRTLPYVGAITVNGSLGAIDGTGIGYSNMLVYDPVTYSITFSESGLPSGLTWQVTVDGATQSLTTDGATDQLTFTEGLTTFSYSVADNSGWHQTTLTYSGSVTMSGASMAEPTLVYRPVAYTVTIGESTLPSGDSWSITLNGVTQSTTTGGLTDTLTWTGLANGTYRYTITDVAGWHQGTLPYGGTTITVSGGMSAVNGRGIGYAVTLVYTPVTYTLTFSESGLTSGLSWQVTVNGSWKSLMTDGATDSLTWTGLTNGTVDYTIGSISGYTASLSAGSVVLAGAAQSVSITFVRNAPFVASASFGLSALDWTVLTGVGLLLVGLVAFSVRMRRSGATRNASPASGPMGTTAPSNPSAQPAGESAPKTGS